MGRFFASLLRDAFLLWPQACCFPSTVGPRRYHYWGTKPSTRQRLVLYARKIQDDQKAVSKPESPATKEPTRQTQDPEKDKKSKRRTWEESYDLVVKYYKEHRNANVPMHYKKDPKLGGWIISQRKRKGSLPADKIAKLDALNFTWDGVKKQKADEKWEEMFQCLKEYKQEEGDCNVPGRWPQNQKLALWVMTQRAHYRDEYKCLTPDRIAKLESIGFVWRLKVFGERGADDGLWNERYLQLIEYKKINGDCIVPRQYEEDPALGNWVYTQRKMWSEELLLPQRKEQLEAIGFVFSFEEIWDQAWQTKFNQLKRFQDEFSEEERHERQSWAPSKQKDLWNWEFQQQDMYKRNTLNATREAMLQDIGYWESLGLKKV